MELSPLDLLDAARRWSAEADVLRPMSAEVRGQSASAFGHGVQESALACAAAWGDATGRMADHVERCAAGLRHTAQLALSVDADVAASFHRLAEGLGR